MSVITIFFHSPRNATTVADHHRTVLQSNCRYVAFPLGVKMKKIVLLALLCTSSEALAQTSQCQSIPKASDRLACYDKAAPPTAAAKPATSKTSAPDKTAASKAPTTQQGTVVDMLAVENSKLDAKIKTICRGC
jgi:hypothetical protein